ncbi:MAG: ABC transporter ATP-binding protein [Planctomycetes bacterium]|nr:ABC transporter ATP-binding protein [Planctomycetota bacterium]
MTPPDAPLLSVSGLCVRFPTAGGVVRAVEGVSFELRRGETLGLVGESGSGKSTTARAIVGLVPVAEGSVRLDGTELVGAPAALRRARPRLQMVFQDPYASLNPRMTVSSIVGEPLVVHRRVVGRAALDARVCRLLETVGLDASLRRRYPHEFSGGQRQRIGLARALALEPDVILLDEPVSALDVSVQAQVLNLLEDLRRRLGLTYLFIAHNLGVVRHVSDRIAVMYLGRLVEVASRDALFGAPLHPYTEALLSAVPVPDPVVEAARRRIPLDGEIPSPTATIAGCPFRSRCSKAFDRCATDAPALREHRPGQWAACHLPERS